MFPMPPNSHSQSTDFSSAEESHSKPKDSEKIEGASEKTDSFKSHMTTYSPSPPLHNGEPKPHPFDGWSHDPVIEFSPVEMARHLQGVRISKPPSPLRITTLKKGEEARRADFSRKLDS